MISLVVATDKSGLIGRENKIPWRLRDDLINLSNLTRGHAVIIGRKTFDSLLWYYDKSGNPLPGKMYIVVSRNQEYMPVRDNAMVVHSIGDALRVARDFDEHVFILGGASVYGEMLPFADRIYLTEVKTHAEGDAHFTFDRDAWREVSREPHPQDERNEYAFDLVVLDKA
jgi:dihydrofolate reductase